MRPLFDSICRNIGKVIIGKDETIKLILTSLVSGGHVLLDDVPGTGKTVLSKSLSRSLDCDFSRIQFTPDLLPSDVTGLNFFHQKENEFVFRKGPVFTNILLADEINRATPRTQSALLECMEEKQVTIDGETRKLSAPFFVIATENPLETTGTFPLPEAQLDRFFMKLSMGTPTKEEEVQILQRFMKNEPLQELQPVASGEDIIRAGKESRELFVHPALLAYIADIAKESREHSSILTGVSPRGSIALLHAAQSYAYIEGRDYVVPEDIKAVAEPVLAHRLVLSRAAGQQAAEREAIRRILDTVTVPTEDWRK